MRGDHTVIARAELGAEAAAGELAHHAHLALRQREQGRQLFEHRVDALRALVDGEPVRLPVRDRTVRLHRRMRLHFGRETFVDAYIAGGKRRFHVAFLGEGLHVRAADVAFLRQCLGRSATSGGGGLLDGSFEDER